MLHLKINRKYLLNFNRYGRLWVLRSQSISDATPLGPLEAEEAKKAKRQIFGSDLPHGVRDAKDAKYLTEELSSAERRLIFEAIRKKMTDQYMEHKRLGNAAIHIDDLLKIWYVSFIPSFAFGILDSALLIFAGYSINSTFAAAYGMSIMGAAALGNIVTNVLLFETQMTFRKALDSFGLKYPVLSSEQMHNKDVSRVRNWAKGLGILLGSICGLFPLMFYDNLTTEELERKNKALVYLRENKYEAASDYQETAGPVVFDDVFTDDVYEAELKMKEFYGSSVLDPEDK